MASSWFFLSTLNYDARSTTHQIYMNALGVHGGNVATEGLEFFDRTQLQQLPREKECVFVCMREYNTERERERDRR